MDEAAHIRAIVADQDNDVPRLAYADWLDTQGRSERAEFIRVQIELARSPDHPDRAALQARETELLEKHERKWACGGSLCLFFKWRRGFVYSLDPASRGVFRGEDTLKILAEFPLAEELNFGFCMREVEFRHMPALPNLRSFSIGGNARLTIDGIRRIGRWRTLRRLRITGDQITDAALPLLAGLAELRELDLSYSKITDAGLSHLVKLKELESLDLSHTRISGHGLAVLSRLPKLRRLNLTNTNYSNPGIGGLSECGSLAELRLGHRDMLQPVEDADIVVLQGLASLRVLDLGDWDNYGDAPGAFINLMRERLPAVELTHAGLKLTIPGSG